MINCKNSTEFHIEHILGPASFHIPFCRISKCSHKISPRITGAFAKNPSRPKEIISRPRIFENASRFAHSSENSFVAQLNQQTTFSSFHRRGSVNKSKNLNENILKRLNWNNVSLNNLNCDFFFSFPNQKHWSKSLISLLVYGSSLQLQNHNFTHYV